MLWNDDEILRTELMLQSSPAAIHIGNVPCHFSGRASTTKPLWKRRITSRTPVSKHHVTLFFDLTEYILADLTSLK